MEWWEFIKNVLIFLSPALSALWIWYTTKYLPAKQAREAAEAEGRRLAEGDTREHRQKQEDLELAYHLSENAAVQQVMAELVSNAQEGEREANEFIRADVKNDLAAIIEDANNLLAAINKLTEVEENRAKLFTLQNGILGEISHELRNQQGKITLLIELLKGIDEPAS